MELTDAISREKKIALFFFFIFLDDRLAARATSKTMDILRKRRDEPATDAFAISTAMKIYHSIANVQGSPHTLSTEAWSIPKTIDMGPWRQFRKHANLVDAMTLVWSQILEVKSTEIALGMNVSEGTVLYRLATALKFLGTMAPLGGLRG